MGDSLVDLLGRLAAEHRAPPAMAATRSSSAWSAAAFSPRALPACTSARPAPRPRLFLSAARFRPARTCPTRRSARWSRPRRLPASGLNVTHPFKQAVIPGPRRACRPRRARSARSTRSSSAADARRPQHRQLGFCRELPRGDGRRAARPRRHVRRRRSRRGGRLCADGTGRRPAVDRRQRRRRAHGDLRRAWAPFSAVASRRVRTRRRPCATANGIVNTTPVGMAKYPGTPFDRLLLTPEHWVADIIYFPAETELLRAARATRLPHAAGHRHGGLPGRPRLRALHRRARPTAAPWPIISRRRHEGNRRLSVRNP